MPVTMISSRPLLAASAGGAVEAAACACAAAGVTRSPSAAVPSAAVTATASVRDVVFMRMTPCCENARVTPRSDVVTGKTGLCAHHCSLPERGMPAVAAGSQLLDLNKIPKKNNQPCFFYRRP